MKHFQEDQLSEFFALFVGQLKAIAPFFFRLRFAGESTLSVG